METCRAFVGIPLPEAYQQGLDLLRGRLPRRAYGPLSFTKPGNWHMTLKFLGEVPLAGPAGIDAMRAALSGVAFAPFVLAGAGGGFFPGPKRPRVVWVGLAQGAEACRALAAAVEEALAPLGFAPENRPFAAHLTVARVREPERGGDWPGMLKVLAETRWLAVTVDAFVLWRSILSPNGPRYEALATFPATGG